MASKLEGFHQWRKNLSNDTMQKLTAAVTLLLMCIFFSIMSPYFLNLDNLITIAMQTAITGITAYGMTAVIISQAVDLSLGSNIAFTSILTASLLMYGLPIPLAILVALAAGALIGACNGTMVSRMKLPPFVATLGMQMALRGLALVVTDSRPVYIDNAPLFTYISLGKVGGILPYPVVYLAILGVVASFVLRKTVIGRQIFAVGSNEEAARLSGIKTSRIRIFAYMFCGIMAAIAGVVMTARVNSGQPTIGVGYEANAIAAAVIGGASMSGGHGSISGTIIGAFIMGVLMNGLNLMSISQNWQTFATGLVVILAVYMDKLRREKRA